MFSPEIGDARSCVWLRSYGNGLDRDEDSEWSASVLLDTFTGHNYGRILFIYLFNNTIIPI